MFKTLLKTGPMAAALMLLSACVNGDGPTGVGVPRPVTIAVVPRFALEPAPAVVAALDRARLTLTNTANDSVLIAMDVPIDPSQAEWTFEMTLQLPSDQVLALRLDIELIDADPAIEVVEFAGRTFFQAKASFEPLEIREINLGRGPLANLSLTSLSVSGARSRLQEGATDLLAVDTVGAGSGQILFFQSTNSDIATVDSVGNIAALIPGSTLIIASGGRVADTLSLIVGQVVLPSPQALQARLVPQIDYVTDDFFLSTLSDRAAALEVSGAIEVLLQEMLAGRGFEAVGRFEEAEALWEAYGAGTNLQFLEGPQIGVITITLMHAADALGIDFR